LFTAAGGLLAELVQVPGGMSEEGLLAAAAERLSELLEQAPYRRHKRTAPAESLSPIERIAWLTAGEREVLRLYFESISAKHVALRLGKRPQTVKNQLRAIEHKLGVDSREAMLAFVFSLLLALHSPK
jgi:DNA-binding CsgD family transcriptional regulator